MKDSTRVLILGATGQVGTELQRSFSAFHVFPADRQSGDLAQPDQIRGLIRERKPNLILNAAAYTAVDRAESESALAYAINAEGPRVLAEEARRSGAVLVHYSTDYVFDGAQPEPWTEDDPTGPINVYGASKLAGEQAIREVGGRYLIFRTSWVYGPHGRNFLLTMLRLGLERQTLNVVNDQRGAPTTSIELANATSVIVHRILSGECGEPEQWAGVYHMTCSGSTTWCDFARAIFERAGSLVNGKSPVVNGIPSSEYPTPAKRPSNSILSNALLEKTFGCHLLPWQSALDAVLLRLAAQRGHRPVSIA